MPHRCTFRGKAVGLAVLVRGAGRITTRCGFESVGGPFPAPRMAQRVPANVPCVSPRRRHRGSRTSGRRLYVGGLYFAAPGCPKGRNACAKGNTTLSRVTGSAAGRYIGVAQLGMARRRNLVFSLPVGMRKPRNGISEIRFINVVKGVLLCRCSWLVARSGRRS